MILSPVGLHLLIRTAGRVVVDAAVHPLRLLVAPQNGSGKTLVLAVLLI